MQPSSTIQNGHYPHWVVVRPEPSGQYTAQLVGIPEIRGTSLNREEAIQQVRIRLEEWLTSGQLVAIEMPQVNPLLRFGGHLDPNDPLEQEFLTEMERLRREDLERTLQESDNECSNSSSTPTT